MYEEFYNLKCLPFENAPDVRFFFNSEQHREALAAIEYTIRMRKGFVLVTGEIGTGKTTIGRIMCERCGHEALIIEVIHGHQKGTKLLRQILRALQLPAGRSDDHATMLERLRDRLVEQFQQDQPVVLFVDEAQTLSDEALEELRLLSNFDHGQKKLIQIVLVGQSELRKRVADPAHLALRQRIFMAKQLSALDLDESIGYIRYRLGAASRHPSQPRVEFSPGAMREIHRITGGVPRLINIACDNCLLLGSVREAAKITPPIVHQVAQDMVPSFDDAPPEGAQGRPPALSLAANF